jgi:site-specific DNA recombinase
MIGRAHGARPRYMCVKDPGRTGCGRIAVFADLAEAESRDKILTAFNDSPALLAKQASGSAGPGGEDPGARLRTIDERRDELAVAWAAGEISRKEWDTAKRVLDQQAAQLTSRLSSSA